MKMKIRATPRKKSRRRSRGCEGTAEPSNHDRWRRRHSKASVTKTTPAVDGAREQASIAGVPPGEAAAAARRADRAGRGKISFAKACTAGPESPFVLHPTRPSL